MSRRRYVSTAISTDTRVKRLMAEHGPMAALLYTWMIPHAEDDGTLPSDPEELQMIVIPGTQREIDPSEVGVLIEAMIDLGLIVRDGNQLRFPDSFYKYQRYIGEARRQRKSAQPSSMEGAPAQNSANPRESAQNPAPFKSSFSSPVKSSFSFSHSVEGAPAAADVPPERRPPEPKAAAGEKNLAPMFDAFTARELSPGALRGNKAEQRAANDLIRSGVPPGDVAECWGDIRAGSYGDLYARQNLSFVFLASHNRIGNWQAWRDSGKPAVQEQTNGRTNGHRQSRGDAESTEDRPFSKFTAAAADAERERRAHSGVPG